MASIRKHRNKWQAQIRRSGYPARVRSFMQKADAQARANGKTLGRPNIANAVRDQVLTASKDGLSVRRIASDTGVSVGTVHGIIKAAA